MINKQPKIRVAWFADDIDRKTKGQAIYSKKLIEQLVKNHAQEVDLTLVYRQGKCIQPECRLARNLVIKTFNTPILSGTLSWVWFFLTSRESFDVFQVPRHNLYPGFLIAKLRGRIKHFVVTLHGAPDKFSPKQFRKAGSWWNFHIKYLAKYFVDKFLAVSAAGQQQIIDYYKIKPVKVDYFHISCNDNFEPLLADEKSASRKVLEQKYGLKFPYILQVGRFDPHKNVHRLIAAYQPLKKQGFDHYLVLVGGRHLPDYSKKIESIIKENNLAESVIVTRNIEATDMPAIYGLADVVVNVSLNEGFGIPLVEAMKTGCAQVVSNIPVFHEVAGDSAYYVNPEDENDIASGLRKVLDSKDLVDELKRRSLKRAERFNWRQSAEKLIKIYRQL